MRIQSIYTLILLCISIFCLKAETTSEYYTYLNEFETLKKKELKIEDNNLIHSNNTFNSQFNIIYDSISDNEFTTYIRFKNTHNQEGKSYKVYNSNKKMKKVQNPMWGFVWNYKDENNYYAVVLKGRNSNLYDFTDIRTLNVQVVQIKEGDKKVFYEKSLDKCVDLYDGYNVVKLIYDTNNTKLFIGNKKMVNICCIEDIKYGNSIGYGYFVGSGASLSIERLVFSKKEVMKLKLQTLWNKQTIDTYILKNNTDNMVGLWKYLDRNTQLDNIKIGGKYTIAIVESRDGNYDILYYDGAIVNSDEWKCGMIKGKLSRTKFQNNYDVVWYDATMKEISDDSYAEIDYNNIITIYFPSVKSKLRFVKQ